MLLSFLIGVPLLGAIALGLLPLPEQDAKPARLGALGVWLVTVGLTVAAIAQFNPADSQMQLLETVPWIDRLGLGYRLGIDGLSLPLLVLNVLLTGIAIFATKDNIRRPRFYYALLLLLSASVNGAFAARDLLLFFLFYELELIPLYLLIGIWGGDRRGYAATKFLIYTALSGIIILAAFLALAGLAGFQTFEYGPLLAFVTGADSPLKGEGLPLATQMLLLVPILIGFGIKIPLVPFHTWLPDAHVEASTPISVLLAGVLLKLGTYGLLRFGLGLLPGAWHVAAPYLAVWATVSVLYGAFAAIAQGITNGDMKKMVAYSSVGHMGFILLAAAAATPVSLMGAEFQMIAHGLISALLFLLVGIVYNKAGTRKLDALSGLFNPERGLPLVGALMVLGVMASGGIPGMAGFISEFLIFSGSFKDFPVHTLISMVGTGLTAVYFLILLNRAFFGRLSDRAVNLPSVSWWDRAPAIALAVPIAALGLLPSLLSIWSEAATTSLAAIARLGIAG
ncbi:MAG: NADH-quinone oxidoreductase subunit M [Cyanophyceae cyanobacterium]